MCICNLNGYVNKRMTRSEATDQLSRCKRVRKGLEVIAVVCVVVRESHCHGKVNEDLTLYISSLLQTSSSCSVGHGSLMRGLGATRFICWLFGGLTLMRNLQMERGSGQNCDTCHPFPIRSSIIEAGFVDSSRNRN